MNPKGNNDADYDGIVGKVEQDGPSHGAHVQGEPRRTWKKIGLIENAIARCGQRRSRHWPSNNSKQLIDA